MSSSQLAAIIGFLFVAAWAALDFGDAVLCLIGAALFYAAAAIYSGEIDLASYQRSDTTAPPRFGRSRVR